MKQKQTNYIDTKDIPVLPTTVKEGNPISGRQDYSKGLRDTKRSFINTTARDITVVNRDGIRFVIKSNPSGHIKNSFIIRTEYKYSREGFRGNEAFRDIKDLMAITEDTQCETLKAVRGTVDRIMTKGGLITTNEVVLCVEHSASLLTLDTLGGSAYIRECDIVVSTLGVIKSPPHPYSTDYLTTDPLRGTGLDFKEPSGLGIKLEIIDNNKTISTRFIHCLGRTFKINPTRDTGKQDGAYVTWADNASGNFTHSERYELDEMESKLGLFRTEEEAVSGGDLSSKLKLELTELNHRKEKESLESQLELGKMKADNQTLNESMVRQKMELDMEYKRMETELTLRASYSKEEAERTKRHYEELSLSRKEHYDKIQSSRKDISDGAKLTQDIIKVLLGVLGATAVFALKSKK